MRAEPFAMVRAFNRMRAKGHSLSLEHGKLVVESAVDLTDEQAEFIHANKPGLVALLYDADTLADALDKAGAVGLSWREGTDWSDGRLLAAGEVLYSQRRMVSVLGRRYKASVAPLMPMLKEASTVGENVLQEAEPA
jgi:hypothetical protein